jgi:hypothetical protein
MHRTNRGVNEIYCIIVREKGGLWTAFPKEVSMEVRVLTCRFCFSSSMVRPIDEEVIVIEEIVCYSPFPR